MRNILYRHLDWTRPLAETAAEALRKLARGVFPADFSHLVVVVPTAEAGRLLRERVAELCADAGGAVGLDITQPEFLPHPAPAATPGQVLLAWRNTLGKVDGRDFAELFRNGVLERFRDSEETLLGWGEALQKCRMSLAAEALDLERAAARLDELCRRSASENSEAEFCRFREFRELEKHYLRSLRELSGGRPDPAVALLDAVEHPRLPDRVETVILIDCSDLAAAPRRFLENAPKVAVECWINAPECCGTGAFGLPDPEYWKREPIELDLRRTVRLVPRPDRQAKLIFELLTRAEKRSGAVGVLDPEVALALETCSELAGGNSASPRIFVPREIPLDTLPWSQLLLAVVRLGLDPTVANAAAVWGDPLFADYARDVLGTAEPTAALELLDRWREEHFVADAEFLDELLLRRPAPRGAADLAKLADAWRSWRSRFAAEPPLAAAYGLLAEIGGANRLEHLDFRRSDAEVTLLRGIVAELSELAASPATQAALLRRLLGSARLKIREDTADAVEAVGFLELPWRSDRTLIIAGFDDGNLSPSSDDLFLPDQARAALGMITRERRRAADAMRFKALTLSRRLVIFCGQSSQTGETRFPARLLFQCPAAELPERVRLLFGRELVADTERPDSAAPPFLTRRAAPRRMRITGFKSYFECPFTFYLEQVLGVRDRDPEAPEMDFLGIGTLTHSVLQHCREFEHLEPEALKKRLRDVLAKEVRTAFGPRRPGIVELQCEMLEESLDYFAAAQCAEYAAGWRIVAAELPKTFVWSELFRAVRPAAPPEAWRDQVEIGGKIDRIDRRIDEDGNAEFRVLDYKTNTAAVPPAKAHLSSAVPEWGAAERLAAGCATSGKRAPSALYWQDLQLPLYVLIVRHLFPVAGEIPAGARIGAGYFNLPLDLTSTGVAMFPELGSAETLASAADCADMVLRRIFVDGIFWPPRNNTLEIFPGCAVAAAHFHAPRKEAEK